MAASIAVSGVVSGTLAVALTGGRAFAAGAIVVALAGVIAVVEAKAVMTVFATTVAFAFAFAFAGTGAISEVVAGGLIIFSTYVGWNVMTGDGKPAFVRGIAIAFVTIGGTCFCSADLTEVNFTQATLKSTDFRKAILTRTYWCRAEKLDRIRPGTTYLKNAQLRQLLVAGQGQDRNFDRQDLRGVNLQSADLQDTSFIGADLSEANLQDANLSRAKLVQTQLDKTNLSGAILTGATLEDWGITIRTKLDGVRCEYVFMRLETKDDPNRRRKPDNWAETFEDGEFGDFIQPIVDTLDLYHSQGVDPRAIAISFKQLAESHPDADLRIVGMEVRGEDKFLLRARTAPDADRSELSAEYFSTYNQLKTLAEAESQKLLAEKDSRIQQLESMVLTVLKRPSFYAETYHNQGDTMSETFNNDLHEAKVANFANKVQDNARQQANQHNYAGEQKQTLAKAAEEIQNLLKVLEKTNPAATQADKHAFVTAAIAPPTKERIVRALQAGGEKALEEFLKNPYVNVVAATIKEWQQAQ